jgi:hypothetical protein
MCIALLYCLGDIDAALTTPTGFPFIEVYNSATMSQTGGTIMVSPRTPQADPMRNSSWLTGSRRP